MEEVHPQYGSSHVHHNYRPHVEYEDIEVEVDEKGILTVKDLKKA